MLCVCASNAIAQSIPKSIEKPAPSQKSVIVKQSINSNWKKKYEYVEDAFEGRYIVKYKDKFGIADRNGNLVTSIEYDEVDHFVGGLASV